MGHIWNLKHFRNVKKIFMYSQLAITFGYTPKSLSQDEYCDHSFAIFQLLQEAILVLLIRPEFHYVFSFIFKFGNPCEV